MIFNAPPTQIRMMTKPVGSANALPHDMAGWWVAGRDEHTRPVDSASLEPDSLAVRAARPWWPSLRRTRKAKSAATPEGTPVPC